MNAARADLLPVQGGGQLVGPLARPENVGSNSEVIRGAGIAAKVSRPAPDSTCNWYSSPRSSRPL